MANSIINFLLLCKNYIFQKLFGPGEPHIEKLPAEVLAVIFSKLEHNDIQQFRKSARFLANAHRLERARIPGPKEDVIVNYKNEKLQLKICSGGEKRRFTTIPLEQWRYVFQNAKCPDLTIETNQDIPIEILTQVLCCKFIVNLTYTGNSINQNIIDVFSKVAQRITIKVEKWNSKIIGSPKILVAQIEDLLNIDDVVEAMKIVDRFKINISPDNFKKTMKSLLKLKETPQCFPWWSFSFGYSNEEQIQPIARDLEKIIFYVFGSSVKYRTFKDPIYETYHLVVSELHSNYQEYRCVYRRSYYSRRRESELVCHLLAFLFFFIVYFVVVLFAISMDHY